MPRPLFDITEDLVRLNDLMDECEGDPSKLGDAEQQFMAWMDKLGDEQATKLDGYVNLMKHLEMEEEQAKKEEQAFAAKRKSRENRRSWLKLRLKTHLEMTGQTKTQTATGRTVCIQANGGKLPLGIDPKATVDSIPERFVKVERSINNEAIREALDAGEKLDFAEFGERGTQLRIR